MYRKIRLFIPVIVALSLMGILYFFFGFFLETYETIISAIFHADFAAPPYDDWPSPGHFMVVPIFAYIADLFPSLPVYGLWLCFLSFLWLTGVVRLWQVVFREQIKTSNVFFILSLILISVLFSESIFYVSLTRVSILLCGIGMLLHYYDGENGRKRKAAYFVLYLLGAITRLHTVVFVMFMLMTFFVVQRESFKRIFFKFYPHALVIGLFLTVLYVDILTTNNLGKILESEYEYAIVDKRSFFPISDMKTVKETTIYLAASHFFITDSLNINKELLNKVVDTKLDFTSLFSFDEIVKIAPLIEDLWLRYWNLICLLFLIIVMAVFATTQKLKLLVKVMALVITFSAIILMLSMFVNMFHRFFSPMFSLLALCCAIICLQEIKLLGKNRIIWYVIVSCILIAFSVSEIKQLKKDSITELERGNWQKEIHDGLAKAGKNKTVVAFSLHENFFTNNPFQRSNNNNYKQVIFPDLTFFTYYKFGQQRLIDKYGFSPLNYKDMYRFLVDNKNDIVIFAFRGKIRLLKYYFNAVYGIRLDFKEVNQNYLPHSYALFKVVSS